MQKEKFWEAIITELQASNLVKKLVLDGWFRPLKILHYAHGVVLIKVSDAFAYDYISGQYAEKILIAAKAVDPRVVEIRFTTEESVPVPKPAEKEKPKETAPVSKKITPQELPKQKQYQDILNTRFVFERFISGYDNEFARKSALSVAENPTENRFSPLYIYGGVGVGKSHLLHSVGNLVTNQRPKARVVLTSGEDFYQNYATALGKKSKGKESDYERFYETFAGCDVLLMDDIQFLSAKPQCQIEFFRIFNTLHQRGALMVFTADRAPEKLKIEDRLISRLQWGLAVELQEPQVETRMAIVAELALDKKLELSRDVISLVAENGPSDIRELDGIIMRLLLKADLEKVAITTDVAEEVLSKRILSDDQKFDLARIIEFTCEHYNISKKRVTGKERTKEVALARQVGMYIGKRHTSFSYKQVGFEFGKDHSTVIHGEKTIAQRIETDEDVARDVQLIIEKLSK